MFKPLFPLQLTFDFLVLLVPTTKLLAFSSGDVGVVGTIHYGGNHTLREKEREKIINNQRDIDSRNNHMACSHKHTHAQ